MSTDTIVRVDPKTLLVGPNVRKEVDLNKEFLASIKELGVRVPITATETAEGLEVVDGQRRTLAAVDLGIELVPVFVSEPQDAAARIIDQIVVNEHRSDLTETDAIAAVQELALFDMKAPAIAKKIGLKRDFVDRAVIVGASPAAKKAIAENNASFETAAAIAAFDEYPEQQKQLVALVANGRYYDVRSRAQEFNDDRARAEVIEQIKAAGLVAVKDPGYSGDDPKLVDRVYLDAARTQRLGELEHEKLVELAGEGLVAFPTFEWVDNVRTCVIGYAIAGWKARGFFAVEYGTTAKPATPEEAEKLKAERRVARENTKAWVAASAIRREFLVSLVQRKTMPKGWEPWVVKRLLGNESHGTNEWRTAVQILGLKEGDSYSLRSVVVKHAEQHPTTVLQTALATAFASIEGGFEFDKKGWAQKPKAYLEQLETWGYELSEIELLACGRKRKITPKAAIAA